MGGSRPRYDVDGYSKRDLSIGETVDERFGATESVSPWYLKRWVLVLWGLTVVILIATIVYGLAILAKGGGGGAPATTTTRPSTTAPSRTTSASLTPSSTTTPSSTVPPASLLPTEVTPQPALPTTTQGRHRHHWNGTIPPLPPIHIPGLNP